MCSGGVTKSVSGGHSSQMAEGARESACLCLCLCSVEEGPLEMEIKQGSSSR